MAGNTAKYEYLPQSRLQEIMRIFDRRFKSFLFFARAYPGDLQYHVSKLDVLDMIIRVDKRKAYFHYFHDDTEINEYKVAALYAYWILKLRPLSITDPRFSTKYDHYDVNELFAIYLICSTLYQTGRLTKQITGEESYSKKLRYSFRYRNFTIDSLLVLVESINEETFEMK
jgi:hypothetical protein